MRHIADPPRSAVAVSRSPLIQLSHRDALITQLDLERLVDGLSPQALDLAA